MYQRSVLVLFLFISCISLQEIRQDVYVFHGQDLTVPCDEGQSCEFSTNVTVPEDIQNCKTTVKSVNVSFDQSKFFCNNDGKVKKNVTIHVLVTPVIYVKDSEGNRLDPGHEIVVKPDAKEINLTFVAENGFPPSINTAIDVHNYGPNYVGYFSGIIQAPTKKENGLYDFVTEERLILLNSKPFEKRITVVFTHTSFQNPKKISVMLKREAPSNNAVTTFPSRNILVTITICSAAIFVKNFLLL